jgi:integrase
MPSTVAAGFAGLRKNLEITDLQAKTGVPTHNLRGEAGSQLVEAGVPIHEARDALGHSSTTMTSTYLHTRRR